MDVARRRARRRRAAFRRRAAAHGLLVVRRAVGACGFRNKTRGDQRTARDGGKGANATPRATPPAASTVFSRRARARSDLGPTPRFGPSILFQTESVRSWSVETNDDARPEFQRRRLLIREKKRASEKKARAGHLTPRVLGKRLRFQQSHERRVAGVLFWERDRLGLCMLYRLDRARRRPRRVGVRRRRASRRALFRGRRLLRRVSLSVMLVHFPDRHGQERGGHAEDRH